MNRKKQNLSDERMAALLGINVEWYTDMIRMEEDDLLGYSLFYTMQLLNILNIEPFGFFELEEIKFLDSPSELSELCLERITEKNIQSEEISDLLNVIGDVNEDISNDILFLDYLFYDDLKTFF